MTTAAEARRSLRARQKRRKQAQRYRQRRHAEAKLLHKRLVEVLGAECALCGERGETAPLTVDHRVGLDWTRKHNRVRYDQRVRRYWAEYERGVPLRCLCTPCNSSVGRPDPGEEPAPF